VVTRNSEPKGQPPFLCTPSIFFCRGQSAAVTGDQALVDDALDGQGDTARQDANRGKRSLYNCTLFGLDIGVPRTFDLVQEPTQSAMSPDEAGSGLLCILPEVHGTAAAIDGAAIIAEAVAPRSGERSQLGNSIKAPSEADCWRRHHCRQRQTVDPELNDRGGEPWVSKRPISGGWGGSRCANASAIRCIRARLISNRSATKLGSEFTITASGSAAQPNGLIRKPGKRLVVCLADAADAT
jgi:hypothetical protein